MERKEIKKIQIVFLGIAVLAFLKDLNTGVLDENNVITRSSLEDESKEVEFLLEIEGEKEMYPYALEILPVLVTKQQAKEYFEEAKKEIASTVCVEGDYIRIAEAYVNDLVLAEWKFSPVGYIDSSGYIDWEKIGEENVRINAEVRLRCGTYEEKHVYDLSLEKELSQTERLIKKIDTLLQQQMKQEGDEKIQLPTQVDGKKLYWKEEKEYLAVKVVFLEMGMLLLLFVMRKREEKEEERRRKESIEYEYPDLINQLSVLLGAGMTTRQAWMRIAKQYQEKKRQNLVKENILYETIVLMVHRLAEGETERIAYETFAAEMDVASIRRLMRSLVANLEKGSVGILTYLEEEEKQAYETRLLHAKKIGEETSTKMLVPLMIQMILIMAVVLAPAIIGFMN